MTEASLRKTAMNDAKPPRPLWMTPIFSRVASVFVLGIVVVGLATALSGVPSSSVSNIGFLVLGAASIYAAHLVLNMPDTGRGNTGLRVGYVSLDFDQPEARPRLEAELHVPKSEPWSVSAEDFVGIDNALALAKFRIDAEQAIRHCLDDLGLEAPNRVLHQGKLLEEISRHVSLNPNVTMTLSSVMKVANQVVHGASINTESTADAVSSGYSAITEIRRAARERGPVK